jgi:hypothetical protein
MIENLNGKIVFFEYNPKKLQLKYDVFRHKTAFNRNLMLIKSILLPRVEKN